MITINYKNKEYKVIKIEPATLSFGGGLEVIDDGSKITCENNEIFFFDPKEGKYYEEKHCCNHCNK